MLFGVIPPGYDVEGGTEAHLDYDVDGHCFYDTVDGHRFPGLNGPRLGGDEQGDRIGMLLDLDQGSMTVWKNNESTLYSTL